MSFEDLKKIIVEYKKPVHGYEVATFDTADCNVNDLSRSCAYDMYEVSYKCSDGNLVVEKFPTFSVIKIKEMWEK